MRHYVALVQCKLMCLRDDLEGVTAMEYGVLAGTTIVAGLAAIAGLGTSLGSIFATIAASLATASG